VVLVGSLFVLLEGSEGLFPGVWLMFAGTGLVMVGAIAGSARTGSWSTWDEKVYPTYFEALVGLTGVALAASPFIVLLVRFAKFYVQQVRA
jgi:hypothetical protein